MPDKRVALTVDVEEWFHTKWFDADEVIRKYYGGVPPHTDVELSVKAILDLFEAHGVRSTFFVLMETVERHEAVLEMIVDEGHEVALHGLRHKGSRELGEKFAAEAGEAKGRLERSVGPVLGFRTPNAEIDMGGLRALEGLGFKYDSSVVPCRRIPGWYGHPRAPYAPYRPGGPLDSPSGDGIVEFPLAVHPTLRVPAHGGWFLRNLGPSYIEWAIRALLRKADLAVLYFHPWEVSERNPRHPEIPFHVFRRTGRWALKALDRIIRSLSRLKGGVGFVPLAECLEEVAP